MTRRNKILRNCIKRVETICTNALQSQVDDDAKCELILKRALRDITQTASDGTSAYFYDKNKITTDLQTYCRLQTFMPQEDK